MKIRTLLISALVCTGCGIKRVPDSVLERLPYEARIELLESENDLALAVDKVDESHNEVLRTRDAIRRAKERIKVAASESASDSVSREVVDLSVREGEGRLDYLKSRQRVNVREEEVAEKGLKCALARFEAARLTAARKFKLEGIESLDLAAFEQQVKDCEAQMAEMKAEMKEVTAEAETSKNEWEKARQGLAKKTFDARASPYVE
jgi:hypothetical protein